MVSPTTATIRSSSCTESGTWGAVSDCARAGAAVRRARQTASGIARAHPARPGRRLSGRMLSATSRGHPDPLSGRARQQPQGADQRRKERLRPRPPQHQG